MRVPDAARVLDSDDSDSDSDSGRPNAAAPPEAPSPEAPPEAPPESPASAIARFWALTRHTASLLATSDARLPPEKTVLRSFDDRSLVALIRGLDDTVRRRHRRRPDGAKPQRPLPLRVPATDPRHLQYDDALAGSSLKEAAAFLNETATADEWRVALNVGAARLFAHHPHLALASPALVEALVGFLTREEVLRVRARADAARDAREKRSLARALLKLFAAERGDVHTVFTHAATSEALNALARADAKPRHLRFALQFLLLAPAHVVAHHARVGRVDASVHRLGSDALITFAKRLQRRIASVTPV